MLPVFRCVACAGCCAHGALLVVTCDVTWVAEPLSILWLPVLLPACVCCARVTVVAVVVVTCDVACLSLRRVRWMFRPRRFVGCYLRCHLGCWTLVPSVVTCVVTCVCVLWACYRRGCGGGDLSCGLSFAHLQIAFFSKLGLF